MTPISIRHILTVYALLLSTLMAGAQVIDTDTVQSRYRVAATMFGIGRQKALDTYLSPFQYAGPEASFLGETMRLTRFDRRLSVQSLFRVYAAMPGRYGYDIYTGLVNWNYGMHYRLAIGDNLKLLFGGMGDLNAGFIYNPRNSNNPASAKAFIDLDASAMAIYHFRLGRYHMTARYQANMPVAGLMFSPDYGSSYYEMFYLGYRANTIKFTSLHNHLSLRQMLTLDFPLRGVTLRAGYYWEIEQSHVNHLKTHTYSHTFMLGFVRHIKLIRDRHGKPMPAAINPF